MLASSYNSSGSRLQRNRFAGMVALLIAGERPLQRPISSYSIGPLAWVYRMTFLSAGACYLALAVRSTKSPVSRIAFTLGGLGSVVAAAFSSSGLSLTSPSDRLHALGSMLFLCGPTVAFWDARIALRPRRLALRFCAATAMLLLALAVYLKVTRSDALGLTQVAAAIVLILVDELRRG